MLVNESIELTEDMKKRLDDVCSQYYEKNQSYKSLKSANDVCGDNVKELFKEYGINKFVTADGIRISITNTTKTSFCEEQLIPFLRECGLDSCIETREFVNMDALEDALYHGDNSLKADLPRKLAPFKEDKIVTRLNCTKAKILNEATT